MPRRDPPADEAPLTALVPASSGEPPPFNVPEDLLPHAARFLEAARAPNTRKARRSDWAVFTAWCSTRGRASLPAHADTVFSFLTEQAGVVGRKPATLHRYRVSIAVAHRGAGFPDPTTDKRVRELVAGIRRVLGMRQRQAAPMTRDVLELVRPHCAVRGWAVLCFGQAWACRRSELCALNFENVQIDERGVAVDLERSKTDQEARGRVIAVWRGTAGDPLCPVRALESYLDSRGRGAGPLFRAPRGGRQTTKDVDRIVKRATAAAGLDASLYSAHSLRAGYVTDARRAGKSWAEIQVVTGHQSIKTVMGYARYEVDPFERPKE